MEITGLQCNNCGVRAFGGDGHLEMWATVLVSVNAMRLERRLHFCPQCFTTWNNGLHHEAVRIDADLAKALSEEDPQFARLLAEEVEIDDGVSSPKSPATGQAFVPAPPAPTGSRGNKRDD